MAQLQLAAAGGGWMFAADATLDAMQRLLTTYSWSADDVRDNLHAYFTVYARALDTVPGDFAHHPNMSISQALTMSNLITQQLGTNSVETLK